MDVFDKILEFGLTKFGDIQFQIRPPKVRAADCRAVMNLAEPGMIILRGYDFYADSLLIPGLFSHSGIVESKSMVIHAVAEGVGREDILDFIKDADRIALLQPERDYYQAAQAVQYARNQIGQPYDFHFNVTNEDLSTTKGMQKAMKLSSVFCNKLSALSVTAGGVNIVPMIKKIGLITHEVYLADQFLEDKRIKTIYRC
jgi:hypothetical protein